MGEGELPGGEPCNQLPRLLCPQQHRHLTEGGTGWGAQGRRRPGLPPSWLAAVLVVGWRPVGRARHFACSQRPGPSSLSLAPAPQLLTMAASLVPLAAPPPPPPPLLRGALHVLAAPSPSQPGAVTRALPACLLARPLAPGNRWPSSLLGPPRGGPFAGCSDKRRPARRGFPSRAAPRPGFTPPPRRCWTRSLRWGQGGDEAKRPLCTHDKLPPCLSPDWQQIGRKASHCLRGGGPLRSLLSWDDVAMVATGRSRWLEKGG